MARIICLANSWRQGGRCIAGIRTRTGKWIRPVPEGGGPISAKQTFIRRHELKLLDVVTIPVRDAPLGTKYQCENHEIADWDWRLERPVAAAEIMQFATTTGEVLHGPGKIVDPSQMELLPLADWASLQLVHVSNAQFERDLKKANRWKVRFSLRAGPEYILGLTDPVATERLNRGETIGNKLLMTVSLTEPIAFSEHHLPALCYKLVAAVIDA